VLEVLGLQVLALLELLAITLFYFLQVLAHTQEILLLLAGAVVLAVQVNLQRVALVVVVLMALPLQQLVHLAYQVKEMLVVEAITLQAHKAVAVAVQELLEYQEQAQIVALLVEVVRE
jgi:hypothetical protein